MNTTQKTVCKIIEHALFSTSDEYPERIDWQAVFTEMVAQGIENIPGSILKNFDLPNELYDSWKKRIICSFVRFSQVAAEQGALCNLLEKNTISYVIIKGLAASQYYPIPEYRTLGDVDFIVPYNDFASAEELICKNGYYEVGNNGRHVELRKQRVLFEMHHFFSHTGHEELDKIIFNDMMDCKRCDVRGARFFCLSDDVNGLVILQHIRQHFVPNGGLGLRQVIDWMLYVDKHLNDEHWKAFKSLSDKTGLTQLAITITRMCQIYLGLRDDISWCHDVSPSICEEVIEFIFENGNFCKKVNRNEAAVLTVSREFRSVGLLKKIQRTGLERWKMIENNPLLTPFAWFYGLYFYIKRGLEVGGISNAINGYKKGKRFDKLLKRLNL